MGYSFPLEASDLLYAPSHRKDNSYDSQCFTSCGLVVGMRSSSMDPVQDIDPTTNCSMSRRSTRDLHLAPSSLQCSPDGLSGINPNVWTSSHSTHSHVGQNTLILVKVSNSTWGTKNTMTHQGCYDPSGMLWPTRHAMTYQGCYSSPVML